ncbi:LysR family transcriptional regulator [Pantoea sp. Ap-967]|uniref:LysR family transcriptional regulator n=1 Tax=Pantoea sp. Ap-967 TaxID=2608362 RepID=UPI0014225EEF|nr:LysR family transcriptional regulator [Pantoea sp. Ap-967]NIE73319.1 LysR family transcriptional regulator [Pantoea sp. Ap-967]
MRFENVALLRFFVAVVESGSLSAAARLHHVSLPAASRKLAQLEGIFGLRLLHRTTRRQSLTEEGQKLYEKALSILDELESLERTLRLSGSSVSGQLRVTAPVSFGRRRIAPLLAQFSSLHPQLRIQLHLTDHVLDMVDSGVDVAIRYGALDDSSYVSRSLAPSHRVLCASPNYISACGKPESPQDLLNHRCLVIGMQPFADWRLGEEVVRITPSFCANDGDVIHQMALEGHGIALKSIWDVADDLRAGKLCHVLPQFQTPATPLHVVYAHRHYLAPRIRAFTDYLIENLRRPDPPAVNLEHISPEG